MELYDAAKNTVGRQAQHIEDLQTSNVNLNTKLNEQNEEIRSWVDIVATLEDSLGSIDTTPDTIHVYETGESMPIARFQKNYHEFTIQGYFQTQAPWQLYIERIKAEIALGIGVTQTANNTWQGYVSSVSPRLIITSLDVSVNPYTPSFWEKLYIGVMPIVSTNRLGVGLYTHYQNHLVFVMQDTYGSAIGYGFSFHF